MSDRRTSANIYRVSQEVFNGLQHAAKAINILVDKKKKVDGEKLGTIVYSLCNLVEVSAQERLCFEFAFGLIKSIQDNKLLAEFLKKMVCTDVATSPMDTTSLTPFTSLVLQEHFKISGQSYVKQIFGDIISKIISRESNNTAEVLGKLVQEVIGSVELCPIECRVVCAILHEQAGKKFGKDGPLKSNSAVAELLVNSFYCPAIKAPQNYGITNKDISKDSQQFLNNVSEDFSIGAAATLAKQNDFIKNLINAKQKSKFSLMKAKEHEPVLVIHRFVNQYLKSVEPSFVEADYKNASSLDVSVVSNQPSKLHELKGGKVYNTMLLTAFMTKMQKSNVPSEVMDRMNNVFYMKGITKNNMNVCYLIPKNYELEFTDQLFYHVFNTMKQAATRDFVVIIDCSTCAVELPVSQLLRLNKILPLLKVKSLQHIFVLNPNLIFKKTCTKLLEIAETFDLSDMITLCSDIFMLYNFIDKNELHLPSDTAKLEQEVSEFTNVERILPKANQTKPTNIRVCETALQIITLDDEILGKRTNRVDVISFEVVNSLTRSKNEANHLVLAYDDGITVNFISPSCDDIIKQVREIMRKRWIGVNLKLQIVLSSRELRSVLYKTMEASATLECLLFYERVLLYKATQDYEERVEIAQEMFENFLKSGSMNEINVFGTTKDIAQATFDQAVKDKVMPPGSMFDDLQTEVVGSLAQYSYPQFLQGDFFAAWLDEQNLVLNKSTIQERSS